jgi:glycerate-2-kinase
MIAARRTPLSAVKGVNTSMNDPRKDARSIWTAGLEAVDPACLVKSALCLDGHYLIAGDHVIDLRKLGRIAVVGAGKACGAMAEALEAVLGKAVMKTKELDGWVNVLDPQAGKLSRIVLHGARSPASPWPTAKGVRGARKMIELMRSLGPDDVAICLLSGGGSAMMPAPATGVPLSAKKEVTKLLSNRGATIEELNCVRKHLSEVKGGRLAQERGPGALVSLIISDVVGDRLEVIASGPTVPDRTTYKDALSVLNKFEIVDEAPHQVMDHIARGVRGEIEDTPDQLPGTVKNLIVGNNFTALTQAESEARRLGYSVLSLGSHMEGEAGEIGKALACVARSIKDHGRPVAAPACVIWGGETTVSDVAPRGKGGRNQHLILSALDHLSTTGMNEILVFSASTDGEDGPTDAAGGFADQSVLNVCRSRGLDPRRFLKTSNSYRFLERVGAHFKPGPTGTNVMDISIVLVN